MLKLHVINVSTRKGRQGLPVANWYVEKAKAHGKFEVKLVDLAEVNLPVFDEEKHPRFKTYEHEHTKKWSAIVEAADAFVFVTPEYNYFAPPSFANCVDYLFQEWNYKPVGFCSYGGPAGGVRAVQMEKLQLTSVKAMPIPEHVFVPFFTKQIENGVFKGNDTQDAGVPLMLNELEKWATALKTIRG